MKIVLQKQLDEYVSLQLTVDGLPWTLENCSLALASLTQQCAVLTQRETSPGAGRSTRLTADHLTAYSFARMKLELTEAPSFSDGRRSFNFFIGSSGVGVGAVAQLTKSVAFLEETEGGAPLIDAGWLSRNGQRKLWEDLIGLESFTLKLKEAGRIEVDLLRERIGCSVQEYKTAVLMAARRSLKGKALAKHKRGRERNLNSVRSDLHSLDIWASWTPAGGIAASPPQPSDTVVNAALDENFPWAAGERGTSLAGLLPAVRITLAKSRSE